MFTSARLKLTGLYLAIILAISGTLSMLFYMRTASILDAEYQRLENRFRHEQMGYFNSSPLPPVFEITRAEIDAAKHNIAIQLLTINGIIIVFFGTAGYFLSGKTLQPIKQALENQKRFVADAAHELRTPITALKTSMEVNLLDASLPVETSNLISKNLEDVDNLTKLAENLLELTRQEDGTVPTERVTVNEILLAAMQQVQSFAQQKSITIQYADDTTLAVHGNKESLSRLFVIFLDNAIKYSNPGSSVTIKTSKKRNHVTIDITDTGRGISKQDLPFIFDRFYRVDTARENNGYGLGLSLAQSIVTTHGGTITVESNKDIGTTFTITLPAA